MSYYPEPDGHINHKIKVLLDSSNYTTKKKVDSKKGDFIALKAEVDKVDISKLVNVPTGFDNLEINVDDLNVAKLKIVSVTLKN